MLRAIAFGLVGYLIGDVIIEEGCYIGPCASLRGDFGRIIVRKGSNVQDNCTLHSTPGFAPFILHLAGGLWIRRREQAAVMRRHCFKAMRAE